MLCNKTVPRNIFSHKRIETNTYTNTVSKHLFNQYNLNIKNKITTLTLSKHWTEETPEQESYQRCRWKLEERAAEKAAIDRELSIYADLIHTQKKRWKQCHRWPGRPRQTLLVTVVIKSVISVGVVIVGRVGFKSVKSG